MKTNFNQLKENASKKLEDLAKKIKIAKTYDEAYDLWNNFSDNLFVDLTGVMICEHCVQNEDDNCDTNCHENCLKWLSKSCA